MPDLLKNLSDNLTNSANIIKSLFDNAAVVSKSVSSNLASIEQSSSGQPSQNYILGVPSSTFLVGSAVVLLAAIYLIERAK